MIGRGCIQSGAGNWRHRPVGSILIRPAGKCRRRPHAIVKVRDHGPEAKRWRYLSAVVWERHNGKLPEGWCLWHRNLDSLDCRIENLEAITLAERLKRNVAANYETWRANNAVHTAANGKKYWRTALDARRVKAAKKGRDAEMMNAINEECQM